MSQRSKTDVIIAVYPHGTAVVNCVLRILEHGGDRVGRLILFDDLCLDSTTIESVEGLARVDARIHLVAPFIEAGPRQLI